MIQQTQPTKKNVQEAVVNEATSSVVSVHTQKQMIVLQQNMQ